MARQFAAPPDVARPWVWAHWLYGNVTKESITRDLEAMKRVGLGGLTMFDVAQPGIPAGPNKYMDAGWQSLFAHEMREADRLGLEVMSHVGPGYCGTGGPWITPALASQKIVESSQRIEGGRTFHGTLPLPASNGDYYRDVAVIALRETEAQAAYRLEDLDMKRLVWLNYIKWAGTQSANPGAKAPAEVCIPLEAVVNLTGKMSAGGILDWEVPAGSWTILRFGHTWTGQKTLPATPEGQGPECDKLDKRGIQAHFSQVMARQVELAGPRAGSPFVSFFMDSWEAGGQNWTERMPEEFKARRGYDPRPFLPILTGRVLGDLQSSERFLYDLRLTVSELAAENFWAELQRLCHDKGIRLAVQPYITTGNDLDAALYSDEPMGEFWSAGITPTDYRISVKEAASVANMLGKAVVGVEAFTANPGERWQSHPATLKALGDQILCLGGNRFQFHRFAMQRFPQLKPGMMMGGWGQQYDRTQTWWEWSKPWHDYLARCQWMLRQGRTVTDVLKVMPEEALFRFVHAPVKGYDYDGCGPELFRKVRLEAGKPGLPQGARYELLQVEHTGTMSLARLRQLRELVRGGANLLGEPPLATPGLANAAQNDAELASLVAELWGTTAETERRVGLGRVFRGIGACEALARLQVAPDFVSSEKLSWIHRRSGARDIYFLASDSEQAITAGCLFRIGEGRAELFDPATGSIRMLDTLESGDGRTAASIPLGPRGSVFVVFDAEARRAPALETVLRNGDAVLPDPRALLGNVEARTPGGVALEALPSGDGEREFLAWQSGTYQFRFAEGGRTESAELSITPSRLVPGPWKLSFPEDSGAPAGVTLQELYSWSLSADTNIRHHSGAATYRNSFELPAVNSRVLLDLGRVEVMARVRVNGRELGILWKPPYRIDITESLRTGTNELEIEVVNLWVNRLIGDASLPEDAEREKNGRLKSWPRWVLDGRQSPAGRRSFVTFPLWKKGEPLKDSGLLGPVVLHFPCKVVLRAGR